MHNWQFPETKHENTVSGLPPSAPLGESDRKANPETQPGAQQPACLRVTMWTQGMMRSWWHGVRQSNEVEMWQLSGDVQRAVDHMFHLPTNRTLQKTEAQVAKGS